MAKPKFYLEPRPTSSGQQAINMFYSFAGQRLQYYTGIRIDIKYFRPECNKSNVIPPIKSTAPQAASYNKKLNNIQTEAIRLVNEGKGETLSVKYIREQLDLVFKPKAQEPVIEAEPVYTFISYFEKYINERETGKRIITSGKNKGSRFTANAIKNYKTSLAAVKRYCEHNGIDTLSFDEINSDFYNGFSNYCFNVEQKEVSTFSNYIRDIKSVMSEAAPGQLGKDFIKPGYEADTLYLTSFEIDKIAALELSDHTQVLKTSTGNISYQTLEKVRDLFLIGAYTGLRFSDFSILELQRIDGNFIKVKQTKTGSRVTIPIMSKLRPVLNKYPKGLPSISNQKFNNYIKHVAELAGLTELRTVINTKGNKQNETTRRLCDLVSSHCCRRSYATNMFKAGVPPMLIMSSTGHKTETSFLKYIRANNEDKANLLAETLQKLGL